MAPTIGNLLHHASAKLHDTDNPELEARRLLSHTLGITTTRLYITPDSQVAAPDITRYEALVERRAAGEPLAYITGWCGFWELELAVNPAVLIPRPDTETLVETALAILPDSACTIADLGTGSGAIALALAKERPSWDITATDTSGPALACARDNAHRLGLNKVDCALGDWFEPLEGMHFDAILSNPPYVAPDDEHLRAAELTYEPAGALAAAAEGLAAIAHITRNASTHLNAGGWLMVEHGFDQGRAVRALLVGAGLSQVATKPDLAGRERVTLGRLA